jgi:Ca2+:H+ antiporter
MTASDSESKAKEKGAAANADPILASTAPSTNPQKTSDTNPAGTEIAESTKPPRPALGKRIVRTARVIIFGSWANVLLVFVPVGVAVHFAHAPAGVVFAMNAIAIVPLAGLLGKATETVAAGFGDAIGALMNVTFGNAVELIILLVPLFCAVSETLLTLISAACRPFVSPSSEVVANCGKHRAGQE